ncbi:hypothetical protein QGN32_10350 [Mycolicibacterium sp. ND9-15]|uniref:hypothetical protein n=1 Tax=Mycolicibacterium sp. ND9-15 TaxID=3042320 RepID=UPI002DD96602|nr:hypothetical protein [Mycolicibacterium sp. ND9-15]WSE58209.1 hypothetical protein QGN32_10350 [Mycolicibacterium sp. ND9-15]
MGTTGLSVALITDDARWNLRGRNLAAHGNGSIERIRFDSAADVLATPAAASGSICTTSTTTATSRRSSTKSSTAEAGRNCMTSGMG